MKFKLFPQYRYYALVAQAVENHATFEENRATIEKSFGLLNAGESYLRSYQIDPSEQRAQRSLDCFKTFYSGNMDLENMIERKKELTINPDSELMYWINHMGETLSQVLEVSEIVGDIDTSTKIKKFARTFDINLPKPLSRESIRKRYDLPKKTQRDMFCVISFLCGRQEGLNYYLMKQEESKPNLYLSF
jgi:hypothetical protein